MDWGCFCRWMWQCTSQKYVQFRVRYFSSLWLYIPVWDENTSFCFFILKLIEKFWMNPQYFVKLTDPDETDDVDTCTLIVSLMQKFRRKMRTQMKTVQYLNLAIGFKIYKVRITKIQILNRNQLDLEQGILMWFLENQYICFMTQVSRRKFRQSSFFESHLTGFALTSFDSFWLNSSFLNLIPFNLLYTYLILRIKMLLQFQNKNEPNHWPKANQSK